MDGLTKVLNDSKIGCNLNGIVINHLMYADDSCIMSPSPAGLQKLLDICCMYAESNSIVYNELKTKCICFKPKSRRYLVTSAIHLGKSKLTFVDSIKYLGVIISKDMADTLDMNRHKKYLYSKGNMLCNKFKDCSSEVKVRLFRTYCNNVYGGHLWTTYKTKDMNRLNVAFNDTYRMLFNIKRGVSMSEKYVTDRIDCFKVLLRKAAFSFQTRLYKSDNKYIKLIANSIYFNTHSTFTQLWEKNLYV